MLLLGISSAQARHRTWTRAREHAYKKLMRKMVHGWATRVMLERVAASALTESEIAGLLADVAMAVDDSHIHAGSMRSLCLKSALEARVVENDVRVIRT